MVITLFKAMRCPSSTGMVITLFKAMRCPSSTGMVITLLKGWYYLPLHIITSCWQSNLSLTVAGSFHAASVNSKLNWSQDLQACAMCRFLKIQGQ